MGTVDDVVPNVILESFQASDKLIEYGMSLDRWDILHGEDVWPDLSYQACEFPKELPLAIAVTVASVSLGIGRERLTRRTAREDFYVCAAE